MVCSHMANVHQNGHLSHVFTTSSCTFKLIDCLDCLPGVAAEADDLRFSHDVRW